jgi:hypothetical protein
MRFERKSKPHTSSKERAGTKSIAKGESVYPPYNPEKPTIESCEREIARLESLIISKRIHSRDDIPELEEALTSVKETLAVLSLTF